MRGGLFTRQLWCHGLFHGCLGQRQNGNPNPPTRRPVESCSGGGENYRGKTQGGSGYEKKRSRERSHPARLGESHLSRGARNSLTSPGLAGLGQTQGCLPRWRTAGSWRRHHHRPIISRQQIQMTPARGRQISPTAAVTVAVTGSAVSHSARVQIIHPSSMHCYCPQPSRHDGSRSSGRSVT